jgi:hypothetical protein
MIWVSDPFFQWIINVHLVKRNDSTIPLWSAQKRDTFMRWFGEKGYVVDRF